MIYLNSKMEKFLLKENKPIVLPAELKNIIHEGVKCVSGCIFFKSLFKPNTLPVISFIEKNYGDKSGYEYSINKINIDDYVLNKENVLVVALIFLEEFKKAYRIENHELIVAVITLDDEDQDNPCTFTFYKKRENENVIDINNLNSYDKSVLVYELESYRGTS